MAATGSSVSGSSADTVEGSRPAGASQSLVTSSPPSRTTNELCGRGHRQPVRGQHLELRAQPVRPAAEDHVEVAVRVRGDSARPVGAARQPRGRRGHVQRRRVEALDPALHRGRLRSAAGASRGAARRARPARAGRARPWRRPRGRPPPRAARRRGSRARSGPPPPPSAAGRRPRRSRAAASTRRPLCSGSLEDRLRSSVAANQRRPLQPVGAIGTRREDLLVRHQRM